MSAAAGRPGPASPVSPAAERWLRRLAWLLPADEAAHVRVELERLYLDRRARDGDREALRRLRRDVLAFVPAAAGRLARSAIGGLGASAADVHRAVRALLRAPGLAAVVVSTLALGIGAAALVFSVVDEVLLQPLPFADPDRLVDVWGGMTRGELSEIRERTRTLADVRGYVDNGAGVNLEHAGEAYRLATTFVEPGLFDLLGARPLLGRLFTPEESEPGHTRVAILSESLWRTTFGADAGVVGRDVTLDGLAYRVVGVLPSSWRFPDPADRLWIPLVWSPAEVGPFWGSGGVGVVGRLAPGATAAAAQAELRGFAPAISAANPVWTPDPSVYRAEAEVTPLRESLVGDARPALLLLLSAVGMVLLVVCANVSSLLVARSLERAGTVAVRTALGASRMRVAREALVETVLLGLVGAGAGAALASGGLRLLRPRVAEILPRADELQLDGRVLAVAVGLGLLTGVLAGVLPALQAARRDPGAALRSGRRGAGAGTSQRRLSRALVGAQLAAAVVLVTSSALLLRTLAAVGSVDPGFSAGRLLTADVTFPADYDAAGAVPTYDALLDGVRAVPGVERAALASAVPFGTLREVYATDIENVTTDPGGLPTIDFGRVGPSYFDVMGMAVLEGRAFTDADREGAPLVAVVDERMAQQFWPGESAVGKRVRYPWAGAPWIEVVGVVGSVADRDLTRDRQPRWYVPLAQRPASNVTLVVASALPGARVMPDVRRAVTEVDPRLPVSHVARYSELLGNADARTRLTTWVLLAFALVTLFLGCLGIYALAAHMVRARRREIGVRMALGAGARGVSLSVLREGFGVVVPGALAGLAAAAAASRLLGGMLYGVRPLDPLTYAAVPLLLTAAALLAMWLPARRAARVDPVETFKEG